MKVIQLIMAMVLIFGSTNSFGQKYCCHDDTGAAFDGNDLMSYYDGEILKGNPEYSVNYDGLNLVFKNEINKKRFLEDPEKYMPAYGGWCSIAMSLGTMVEPNFNYYRFDAGGRVLFFEVRAFLNGITLWEKDTIGNKIKADLNYESMTSNDDQ